MLSQDIFCADAIFNSLNGYITQIHLLDNINVSDSNHQEFLSRTLGLISISNQLESKKLDIVKDGTKLYFAQKTQEWSVEDNLLTKQQISAIRNLPQTKEDIFLEFYSRSLTLNLKNIFQEKQYPLNKIISLCQAPIPYNFYISRESTTKKIVFLGTHSSENNIVFKSFFCTAQSRRDTKPNEFLRDYQVCILQNEIPLEHLNQLCS